jgi:hypothetical protein
VFQPAYNDVGPDYPEVEYFDVTLMKDSQGLGITIAGYVGKDNAPGMLDFSTDTLDLLIRYIRLLIRYIRLLNRYIRLLDRYD